MPSLDGEVNGLPATQLPVLDEWELALFDRRTLADTAAHYASALKLSVFALTPGQSNPLTVHGPKAASSTPVTVAKAWRDEPDANIAVVTRPDEGHAPPPTFRRGLPSIQPSFRGAQWCWVLETRGDGAANLAALEREHGPIPETLTWTHPDGAICRLFVDTARVGVGSSAEKIAKGVSVIGGNHNAFVVMPPSVTSLGQHKALNDLAPVAAPAWLIALACQVGDNLAIEAMKTGKIVDPWAAYPAPPFPLDALPASLREPVAAIARTRGADQSAAALAVLVAVSGALDHRFRLQLTPTWAVDPRLWGLLVGPPSAKKTPLIDAAKAPLEAVQAKVSGEYHKAHRGWAMAKEAGFKDPEPPEPIRYIINNITVEKLTDVLAGQDRGALVVHDELSGLIGAMDKYAGGKGAAADRAIWLKAYDGGPYHVDRKSSRGCFVKNLSVSMLGGIQPSRLAEFKGLMSDGLLQRFIPCMMGPSSFPEATASEADAAALAAYAELIAARLTEPHSEIRLLPEAEAVITDLRRWLHELERADAFGENFSSFLGKLAGLAGSLALVLHLAADLDNSGRPIGKGTADAVAKIVREFVVPHGLAFYRATADRGVAEDQRALASYVLTETKARFTASDFTNNVRCVRGLGRWDVFRAVDFMVAYGWLAPEGDHAPPTAWTLTHGLREAMAERREAEAARKVMVRDIIRDAGAKGLSGKDLS